MTRSIGIKATYMSIQSSCPKFLTRPLFNCGYDFDPTGNGPGDGLYFFDEAYSNPSSDKNVIGFFAHGTCADTLVRCSVYNS